LRTFPDAITCLPNLRVLDLSDNPIGVPTAFQRPPEPPEPPFFTRKDLGWPLASDAARMSPDEKAREIAEHERRVAEHEACMVWWRARPTSDVPLPASICKLKRLEELRIAACGFTSLPECLGDLAGLRVLDVTWNPVGRLPASMARLENLAELHASFCAIEALPDLSKAPLEVVQIGSNCLAKIPAYLLERCWFGEDVEYDFSGNPLAEPLRGPERSPEKKPFVENRARVAWDGTPIKLEFDGIDDDDL